MGPTTSVAMGLSSDWDNDPIDSTPAIGREGYVTLAQHPMLANYQPTSLGWAGPVAPQSRLGQSARPRSTQSLPFVESDSLAAIGQSLGDIIRFSLACDDRLKVIVSSCSWIRFWTTIRVTSGYGCPSKAGLRLVMPRLADYRGRLERSGLTFMS